jgi:hypothetical protein
MRRYFFNIVRGKAFISDPEGDDFRGDEEARQNAEEVAREILEDRYKYRGRCVERWVFVITDGTGRHVATVPFSPKSAWAKQGARLPKKGLSSK